MNHTSRCTAQESHTPRASTGITHSRRQHKGQRRNHKHPRGQHRNHTPKGQHRNHTTQGTAYVTSQESHTPGANTGITHPRGQHKNHTPLGTAQESHTPGDNTGITQRTMRPAAITQDITELHEPRCSRGVWEPSLAEPEYGPKIGPTISGQTSGTQPWGGFQNPITMSRSHFCSSSQTIRASRASRTQECCGG